MTLSWKESLATGIRQIDLQHQELIEMINALEHTISQGRRQEALEEVLPRLKTYVLFHFSTENAMLPETTPEHAEQHRQQHQQFTLQIASLDNQAPDTIDFPGLLDYLQRWLVEHIMKTDQELARQLKGK